MFGNKKNNLSARPSLPTVEQISDDIRHSSASDVAFNILAKENTLKADLHFPTNVNDAENIYGKAKMYLDSTKRLKLLAENLKNEKDNLQLSYEEIVKLAQDIREQAKAVLIE
ncbi:hypothetical protein HCN44_009135 [Aphidius gifuensis]|uniref:Uncharacterized protein n=1 Tax=Aphidius gifuensis TaxID=684658 RepID=A0A834Y4M3_APHGI|nr:uncharacterized protein LOC122857515 [Aphidius gifuensis]XP_044015669.1 uncharacterized protein LOC122857515 [Aphidius gifuensis]KAF7997737.1 hypothetical protein HCN44_009135 [Aphidius gifuensis]